MCCHWCKCTSSNHRIQQQGGQISKDQSVMRLSSHVCKQASSVEETNYKFSWMNTLNIGNQEPHTWCPFNSLDRYWMIQRVHSVHSTNIGQNRLKEERWIDGGKGLMKWTCTGDKRSTKEKWISTKLR